MQCVHVSVRAEFNTTILLDYLTIWTTRTNISVIAYRGFVTKPGIGERRIGQGLTAVDKSTRWWQRGTGFLSTM